MVANKLDYERSWIELHRKAYAFLMPAVALLMLLLGNGMYGWGVFRVDKYGIVEELILCLMTLGSALIAQVGSILIQCAAFDIKKYLMMV